MYCVYFLRSKKTNKVYVGFTEKEPDDRLREHNNGSNEWSSANAPLILLYYEKYLCKDDAINREQFYKMGFGRKIRDAIIQTVSTNTGEAKGPYEIGI